MNQSLTNAEPEALFPILNFLEQDFFTLFSTLNLSSQRAPLQQQRLLKYAHLLYDWNQKLNLFSPKSYHRLPFHFLDSIILSAMLPKPPISVLDMGSGSGLPSIILSIMNPHHKVTAVESRQKKCAFLNQAKNDLNLPNYTVIHCDINEYLHLRSIMPHAVTAKAFAPYEKLKKICLNVPKKNRPTLYVPISKSQGSSLPKTATLHHPKKFPEHHYFSESLST